jgi:hypothetical protein
METKITTHAALADTRIARSMDAATESSTSTEHVIDDDDAFDCALVAASISFLIGDEDGCSDY